MEYKKDIGKKNTQNEPDIENNTDTLRVIFETT